ncbi:MAG: DUF2067 family protein [Candidatus Hodarchaeota archaeon]
MGHLGKKHLTISIKSQKELEMFIDFVTKAIKYCDISIKTKGFNCKTSILGDKAAQKLAITMIRKIHSSIKKALYPSADGTYSYSSQLLAKVAGFPVSQEMLAEVLKRKGFRTHLEKNILVTDLDLNGVKEEAKTLWTNMNFFANLNMARSLKHTLAIAATIMELSPQFTVEMATEKSLIKTLNGKYYLKVNPQQALEELLAEKNEKEAKIRQRSEKT